MSFSPSVLLVLAVAFIALALNATSYESVVSVAALSMRPLHHGRPSTLRRQNSRERLRRSTALRYRDCDEDDEENATRVVSDKKKSSSWKLQQMKREESTSTSSTRVVLSSDSASAQKSQVADANAVEEKRTPVLESLKDFKSPHKTALADFLDSTHFAQQLEEELQSSQWVVADVQALYGSCHAEIVSARAQKSYFASGDYSFSVTWRITGKSSMLGGNIDLKPHFVETTFVRDPKTGLFSRRAQGGSPLKLVPTPTLSGPQVSPWDLLVDSMLSPFVSSSKRSKESVAMPAPASATPTTSKATTKATDHNAKAWTPSPRIVIPSASQDVKKTRNTVAMSLSASSSERTTSSSASKQANPAVGRANGHSSYFAGGVGERNPKLKKETGKSAYDPLDAVFSVMFSPLKAWKQSQRVKSSKVVTETTQKKETSEEVTNPFQFVLDAVALFGSPTPPRVKSSLKANDENDNVTHNPFQAFIASLNGKPYSKDDAAKIPVPKEPTNPLLEVMSLFAGGAPSSSKARPIPPPKKKPNAIKKEEIEMLNPFRVASSIWGEGKPPRGSKSTATASPGSSKMMRVNQAKTTPLPWGMKSTTNQVVGRSNMKTAMRASIGSTISHTSDPVQMDPSLLEAALTTATKVFRDPFPWISRGLEGHSGQVSQANKRMNSAGYGDYDDDGSVSYRIYSSEAFSKAKTLPIRRLAEPLQVVEEDDEDYYYCYPERLPRIKSLSLHDHARTFSPLSKEATKTLQWATERDTNRRRDWHANRTYNIKQAQLAAVAASTSSSDTGTNVAVDMGDGTTQSPIAHSETRDVVPDVPVTSNSPGLVQDSPMFFAAHVHDSPMFFADRGATARAQCGAPKP